MDLAADIEGATVNVVEFARVVGVSDQTIRNWMRNHGDFPVQTRGSHGVPYEIPLREGVEWVAQHQAEADEAKAARDEQLDLWREQIGLAKGEDAPARGVTAQERKAEIEAAILLDKLRRVRGELVERAPLEAMLSEAFVGLRKGLMDLPLQFARRVGLPNEHRALLEEMMVGTVNATVAKVTRELQGRAEESTVA